MFSLNLLNLESKFSGGSTRGHQGHAPPNLSPNSYIFMELSAKISANNRLAYPVFDLALLILEIQDPSLIFLLKRLLEPTTFCVRDQDATTAPPRHRLQRRSLK